MIAKPPPQRRRSRPTPQPERRPILQVRPALPDDLPGIMQLIEEFVRRGDILPRSEASVALTLPDWVVAELAGRIVGMGSLLVYSSRLAEVRSLAVADAAQGFGAGRQIVERLVEMARARQVEVVFALTRAVPFFEKLGFHVTQREDFPEKIWHACRVCPLQDRCDETAVVLPLAGGTPAVG